MCRQDGKILSQWDVVQRKKSVVAYIYSVVNESSVQTLFWSFIKIESIIHFNHLAKVHVASLPDELSNYYAKKNLSKNLHVLSKIGDCQVESELRIAEITE